MTPLDAAPLPVATDNVEQGVEFLDAALTDDHMVGITWQDAARHLRRLRAARARLHALESALELHIDRAWRAEGLRQPQAVIGAGMVEVSRHRKRSNWDHEGIGRDLIDVAMRERGGELPDPYEVRDWLLAAAGIGYWRVTALKAHGLDANDYCVVERGVPSVRIS